MQCLLRLLCGPVPPVDLERELAPGALKILLRVMGEASLADLMVRTAALAQSVRQIFERRVGSMEAGEGGGAEQAGERSASSAVSP